MELPDEILLLCFSHVHDARDKFAVLRVNQRWRRVGLDLSLWRVPLSFHHAALLSTILPAGLHTVRFGAGDVEADVRKARARINFDNHHTRQCTLGEAVEVVECDHVPSAQLVAISNMLRGTRVHTLRIRDCNLDKVNDLDRNPDLPPAVRHVRLLGGLRHIEITNRTPDITSELDTMLFIGFVVEKMPAVETLRTNFLPGVDDYLEPFSFFDQPGPSKLRVFTVPEHMNPNWAQLEEDNDYYFHADRFVDLEEVHFLHGAERFLFGPAPTVVPPKLHTLSMRWEAELSGDYAQLRRLRLDVAFFHAHTFLATRKPMPALEYLQIETNTPADGDDITRCRLPMLEGRRDEEDAPFGRLNEICIRIEVGAGEGLPRVVEFQRHMEGYTREVGLRMVAEGTHRDVNTGEATISFRFYRV